MLECSGHLSEGTFDETGAIADFMLELSGCLVGQRYGSLRMDAALLEKASTTNSDDATSSSQLKAVARDLEHWISGIA